MLYAKASRGSCIALERYHRYRHRLQCAEYNSETKQPNSRCASGCVALAPHSNRIQLSEASSSTALPATQTTEAANCKRKCCSHESTWLSHAPRLRVTQVGRSVLQLAFNVHTAQLMGSSSRRSDGVRTCTSVV